MGSRSFVWAMDATGRPSKCYARPENRGRGSCPHVIHCKPDETIEHFNRRSQMETFIFDGNDHPSGVNVPSWLEHHKTVKYTIKEPHLLDGAQRKFYVNGLFVKMDIDNLTSDGQEVMFPERNGLAEEVVCKFLDCTNVKHAHYHCCNLVWDGVEGVGCVSPNFLQEGQHLKHLAELLHYDERMAVIGQSGDLSMEERFDLLVKIVRDRTGCDVSDMLYHALCVDMLVMNGDRHFNNLGVVYDERSGTWEAAPLYDHGAALMSSPIHDFLKPMECIKGSPDGPRFLGVEDRGDYEELIRCLGKREGMDRLQVDYQRLEEVTNEYSNPLYDDEVVKRLLKSLMLQLATTNNLLWEGMRKR